MRRALFAALFLFGLALAEGLTLFAAGDIAYCRRDADEKTAQLIEQRAPEESPWAVLALGDLAYPRGRPSEFARCYDPSWGRFKARTYPVPGNHEYYTKGAAGYFGYFDERAAPPSGYYRLQKAGWSLYALNTNLSLGPSSKQYRWLKAALKADQNPCKLVFMHRPRYSSGVHGDAPKLAALWKLLTEAGVRLVLSGHDHHYERIEAEGPVQFVVGTGGAPLRHVKSLRAVSQAMVDQAYGVLELELFPGGYRFAFVDVTGRVWDQGEGGCAP